MVADTAWQVRIVPREIKEKISLWVLVIMGVFYGKLNRDKNINL
jgi:hypothetical protein